MVNSWQHPISLATQGAHEIAATPGRQLPMNPAKPQIVVLLAESEVLVRNLVRRILESAGFVVLTAAHSTEALTISRGFREPINVLITDVDIPGNGLALAEVISQERPGLLVLLISAGSVQDIPVDMPFIAKPFAPGQLATKLGEVLAAAGIENAWQPPSTSRS